MLRSSTSSASTTTSPIRDESIPLRREPGRITIGTDPTDDRSRPVPRKGRPGEPTRGGPTGTFGLVSHRHRSGRRSRAAVTCRRPSASACCWQRCSWCALMVDPKLVMAVVVVVLGLAAVEYFDKVSEKGYRPATIVGIVACVAMPIAAYWAGERPCRCSWRWPSSPGPSRSSAPRRSKRPRCRTWRSPRWASPGSASSVRSRR